MKRAKAVSIPTRHCPNILPWNAGQLWFSVKHQFWRERGSPYKCYHSLNNLFQTMKDQIISSFKTFSSVADFSFCQEFGQIGILRISQIGMKYCTFNQRCNFKIIPQILKRVDKNFLSQFQWSKTLWQWISHKNFVTFINSTFNLYIVNVCSILVS